jgi:short-subunit dehydrogenase
MIKKKILIFGSDSILAKNICSAGKKKFSFKKINKKTLNFDNLNASKKIIRILSENDSDIILNCSGVLGDNTLKYENVYNTNFGSNWEIAKHYINLKKINKKITIIFIGSTAYKTGKKNYLLYSSSKAALHNLYQGAKKILIKKKIKLLIYHPPRMRTKMIKKLSLFDRKSAINPMVEAKKIINLLDI